MWVHKRVFFKWPLRSFQPQSLYIYHGSEGKSLDTCIIYNYIDIHIVVFSSEVRKHNTTLNRSFLSFRSFIYRN